MRGFFVGIGGQKCGSGWLAAYLYRHPDVLDHPVKEMHVFDALFTPEPRNSPRFVRKRLHQQEQRGRIGPDELAARRELLGIVSSRRRSTTFRRYAEYFTSRVAGRDLAFGEVTPAYSRLPAEGFEAILSVFADARVLFLMRDPVDRVESYLRHLHRNEPDLDLHAGFAERLHDQAVHGRTTYETTLAALDAAVPRDQVFLGFSEELFAPDDDSTLRALDQFLDIRPVDADRAEAVNPGAGWEMTDDERRLTARTFAETYEAVERRMGRLPERWRAHAALV